MGPGLRAWWLLAFGALCVVACGLETEGLAPVGTSGAGGSVAVGGNAGASPVGGSAGSVASGGSGGSVATGGSGGSVATGGSGGSVATGGSGGSVATGGSGGSVATGGSGGSVATGGSGGAVTFSPPWWDTAYKSRWKIQITAPAQLAQGFQVPLPVNAASIDGSGAPFSAWRIARWDGSAWTELDRMIETVAAKQWIWFRTKTTVSGSDDSYWLYANNPIAAPPTLATSVFEFHSFFTQPDTTSWASTGSVSYDGSRVVIDGGGSGGSIRSSAKTFGPGFGVDFAMTVIAPLASSSTWFCGGFQRQNDFTNSSPWVLWISRTPSQIDVESYINPGNWKGTSVPPATGSEHVYSVERFPTKHAFLYDLAQKDVTTWSSSYTQALQIRFSAYNGSKIAVRYARVRMTADPPPQATLGASEVHP